MIPIHTIIILGGIIAGMIIYAWARR